MIVRYPAPLTGSVGAAHGLDRDPARRLDGGSRAQLPSRACSYLVPLALCSVSLKGLFHGLPNAQVRWLDVIVGGLGGIALEMGKRGFAAT